MALFLVLEFAHSGVVQRTLRSSAEQGQWVDRTHYLMKAGQKKFVDSKSLPLARTNVLDIFYFSARGGGRGSPRRPEGVRGFDFY